MFWPIDTPTRRTTESDCGSPKNVGSVVSATIPGGMLVIAGDSQPMRRPLV